MELSASEEAPSRQQRRATQRRIDEVRLRLNAWASPASHAPTEQPDDEWDFLLGPVVTLLAHHRPADEIAARISAALRDHYGLESGVEDVDFASELRAWWDADVKPRR